MLTLFIRGMLCNWMVSAGVVGAMISTTVSGKVIAMWMPIMLFFYMAFEHSIVNMFLFPSGLLLGGKFSIMDYLIWNEIPTVVGNLVGGLAFTGLTLYATHVKTGAEARGGLTAICHFRGLNSSISGLRPHCPLTGQMPRELKISVGQHSDKGRKETNQDFHGVLIPAEPLLEPQGHRHRAGGRHQLEQQCQPDRSRVRGQGISDRLLLHLGILVGARPRPSACWRRPIPGCMRRRDEASIPTTGPRLRLHPERHGPQVDHGAYVPRRRFQDLSRLRQLRWSS